MSETRDKPEPNTAYHFRVPTGGVNSLGALEYREWTQRQSVFVGDWDRAVQMGVLRMTEGAKAGVHELHYPGDVVPDKNSTKAEDRKLLAYLANLLASLGGKGYCSMEELEALQLEAAKQAATRLP